MLCMNICFKIFWCILMYYITFLSMNKCFLSHFSSHNQKSTLKTVSNCGILIIKKGTRWNECLSGASLQKVEFPKLVYILLHRGARPGANRAGIFIFSCFSYRERQATLQSSYQKTSTMLISQWKSKWSHKPSSAPPPFLCIPVVRYHKLGRLPLRSAPVGAKQASPGRLTPCHGYFP